MISMVCPDIVVTISPGRCALPSGMFSTIPIAPTALTLALRAASACMRPTTHAAPAISPFMSSMLAGLDRNAAGIETDAFADEGERRGAALAAVPAHDDRAALVLGALSNAEQRVHAELLHLLDAEYVDDGAEFFQTAGAAGEFFRVEHVGRFIDEIARNRHAVGDGGARGKRLLHRRNARNRDRDLDLGRLLLVVLALGLVTLEGIGAQLHAERHVGGPLGLDGAPGQVGDEGGLARRRRDLAHADAAELDEILSLEVAGLADAHDDKTRQVEPGRRDEVERRGVLALEPIGRRRPPHQIAGRRQRAARGGPEFDPVLTEQDKNTLGGRAKGSKFKLQAAGHEAPPLDSLRSGSRFCGRNQACADCANLFAITRTKT